MGEFYYCCSSAQNTHEEWLERPRCQPHFSDCLRYNWAAPARWSRRWVGALLQSIDLEVQEYLVKANLHPSCFLAALRFSCAPPARSIVLQ